MLSFPSSVLQKHLIAAGRIGHALDTSIVSYKRDQETRTTMITSSARSPHTYTNTCTGSGSCSARPIAFLRPGDTPYPKPNPCPPMTPTAGCGKKPEPLKKGMWE